jgi:hypothetical protein
VKLEPVTTLPKEGRMRWYWWGLLGLLLSLASYALAIRIVYSIDYLKYGTGN